MFLSGDTTVFGRNGSREWTKKKSLSNTQDRFHISLRTIFFYVKTFDE